MRHPGTDRKGSEYEYSRTGKKRVKIIGRIE